MGLNNPGSIRTRNQMFHRFLLTIVSACAFGLIIFAWNTIGQTSRPGVEVVFININHGDSILIRSTKGDTVLIDAGYPNAGTLEYLQKHNISHINTMIATHSHEDHIGGLPEVMRAIPVDKLVVNGNKFPSSYYEEFQNTANELGIRQIITRTGNRIPFGEMTLKVLSPAKIRPTFENINSIVLQLQVGDITFLFTGDTEKPEELRLINSGVPLHADILKVAHHAGATSSDPAFLEKVDPTVAIYSASNNFPGYPNPATINDLLESGAIVYGTNFNGTVTLHTDGKTYTVFTEYGEPLRP